MTEWMDGWMNQDFCSIVPEYYNKFYPRNKTSSTLITVDQNDVKYLSTKEAITVEL